MDWIVNRNPATEQEFAPLRKELIGMNECLKCKYRGTVPHSRHSSCQHPRVDDIIGDSEVLMLYLKGIVNELKIPLFFSDFQVEFKNAAILAGWATFPFNFDPIWLRKCTGFAPASRR